MGSILGGGKSKSSSSSKTNSQSRVVLPDYLKQVIPDLVSRANEVSMTPYEGYTTDQRIEPFNADQLAAFMGTRDLQGQYLPYLDQALQSSSLLSQQAMQGVNPSEIQQWMNPYTQNVTDIGKREALRQFDMQRNNLEDQAIAAGSWGGDREAIAQAELRRNLNTQLGDIQSQGDQQAYQSALSALFQNRGQQGQFSGQLGTLAGAGQQYNLTDLAALQQIGGQQQALGQAERDFDYSQFMEERGWPYQNVSFLQGVALPTLQLTAGQNQTSQSSSTSTQSSPSVSPLSAALGLGSMAMGIPGLNAGLGSLVGSSMANSLGLMGSFSGSQGSMGYNTSYFPNSGNQVRWFKKGGLVNNRKHYQEGGMLEGTYGGTMSERVSAYMQDLLKEQLNKAAQEQWRVYQEQQTLMDRASPPAEVYSEDESIPLDAEGMSKREAAKLIPLLRNSSQLDSLANSPEAQEILRIIDPTGNKRFSRNEPIKPSRKPQRYADGGIVWPSLRTVGDNLIGTPVGQGLLNLQELIGLHPRSPEYYAAQDTFKNAIPSYLADQAEIYDQTGGKAGRSEFQEPAPETDNMQAVTDLMNKFRSQETGSEEPLLTQTEGEASDLEEPAKASPKSDDQLRKILQLMQKPTKQDNSNAWLAMGARMLASPGESPAEALGHGVQSYLKQTSEDNTDALKAKQTEFENALAMERLKAYQMQNQIAADAQALKAKYSDLTGEKMMSEIEKAKSEAAKNMMYARNPGLGERLKQLDLQELTLGSSPELEAMRQKILQGADITDSEDNTEESGLLRFNPMTGEIE